MMDVRPKESELLEVLSRRKSKPFFYGWTIVASGFVSQALQTGFGFSGFGTFLLPLQGEFGWSKTQLAAARSIMQVEGGLIDPIQGAMGDRFGPRVLITLGLAIFGAAMIMLGLVHSLWQYYLAFVVMAIGGSLAGFTTMSIALNNWFRRNRTMAMSLAQMGLGFGGVALVPLLVWAQDAFGWRWAAIAAGITVWVIGIPFALLMRSSPEKYGMLPDGDSPETLEKEKAIKSGTEGRAGGLVDFTLSEALRTPAFWCIGLGHGVAVMAVTSANTHQFAHMEMDQGVGLARSSAAVIVTVVSATNMGGRLIGGFLGDRYDKRALLIIGTALTSGALIVLALAQTFWAAMVFAVPFGIGWGMRGSMLNSLRGQYFGRAAFGKIIGTSSLLTVPFSVFAPIFAGFLADTLGNYRLAFIVLGVLSALAMGLFFAAKQPAPPRRLRGRPLTP